MKKTDVKPAPAAALVDKPSPSSGQTGKLIPRRESPSLFAVTPSA
jgi:hypothetical protein